MAATRSCNFREVAIGGLIAKLVTNRLDLKLESPLRERYCLVHRPEPIRASCVSQVMTGAHVFSKKLELQELRQLCLLRSVNQAQVVQGVAAYLYPFRVGMQIRNLQLTRSSRIMLIGSKNCKFPRRRANRTRPQFRKLSARGKVRQMAALPSPFSHAQKLYDANSRVALASMWQLPRGPVPSEPLVRRMSLLGPVLDELVPLHCKLNLRHASMRILGLTSTGHAVQSLKRQSREGGECCALVKVSAMISFRMHVSQAPKAPSARFRLVLRRPLPRKFFHGLAVAAKKQVQAVQVRFRKPMPGSLPKVPTACSFVARSFAQSRGTTRLGRVARQGSTALRRIMGVQIPMPRSHAACPVSLRASAVVNVLAQLLWTSSLTSTMEALFALAHKLIKLVTAPAPYCLDPNALSYDQSPVTYRRCPALGTPKRGLNTPVHATALEQRIIGARRLHAARPVSLLASTVDALVHSLPPSYLTSKVEALSGALARQLHKLVMAPAPYCLDAKALFCVDPPVSICRGSLRTLRGSRSNTRATLSCGMVGAAAASARTCVTRFVCSVTGDCGLVSLEPWGRQQRMGSFPRPRPTCKLTLHSPTLLPRPVASKPKEESGAKARRRETLRPQCQVFMVAGQMMPNSPMQPFQPSAFAELDWVKPGSTWSSSQFRAELRVCSARSARSLPKRSSSALPRTQLRCVQSSTRLTQALRHLPALAVHGLARGQSACYTGSGSNGSGSPSAPAFIMHVHCVQSRQERATTLLRACRAPTLWHPSRSVCTGDWRNGLKDVNELHFEQSTLPQEGHAGLDEEGGRLHFVVAPRQANLMLALCACPSSCGPGRLWSVLHVHLRSSASLASMPCSGICSSLRLALRHFGVRRCLEAEASRRTPPELARRQAGGLLRMACASRPSMNACGYGKVFLWALRSVLVALRSWIPSKCPRVAWQCCRAAFRCIRPVSSTPHRQPQVKKTACFAKFEEARPTGIPVEYPCLLNSRKTRFCRKGNDPHDDCSQKHLKQEVQTRNVCKPLQTLEQMETSRLIQPCLPESRLRSKWVWNLVAQSSPFCELQQRLPVACRLGVSSVQTATLSLPAHLAPTRSKGAAPSALEPMPRLQVQIWSSIFSCRPLPWGRVFSERAPGLVYSDALKESSLQSLAGIQSSCSTFRLRRVNPRLVLLHALSFHTPYEKTPTRFVLNHQKEHAAFPTPMWLHATKTGLASERRAVLKCPDVTLLVLSTVDSALTESSTSKYSKHFLPSRFSGGVCSLCSVLFHIPRKFFKFLAPVTVVPKQELSKKGPKEVLDLKVPLAPVKSSKASMCVLSAKAQRLSQPLVCQAKGSMQRRRQILQLVKGAQPSVRKRSR